MDNDACDNQTMLDISEESEGRTNERDVLVRPRDDDEGIDAAEQEGEANNEGDAANAAGGEASVPLTDVRDDDEGEES